MKKQILAAGLAAAMSMSALAGCAADSNAMNDSTDPQAPTSQSEAKAEQAPLELVESGYSVGEQGYIHYGVVIKNPNADASNFPVLKITGRDDAGAVVFSEEQTLMNIGGDTQVTWAGQAGNGTTPATIEFEVSSSDNDYGSTVVDSVNASDFTVVSVSETDSGYGTYDFVGEITNNTDKNAAQASIVVLLRNADGAIVGGYNGFSSNVKAGDTTAFDVLGYEVPEHETIEAYAYSWL